MKNKTSAFTLIEIMIVVAIIGLLATLAVPAFRRAQTNARTSAMQSNARQIISAGQQYILTTNTTSIAYTALTSTTTAGNNPAYLTPITPVAGEVYTGVTISATGGSFSLSSADNSVQITLTY